MVSPLYKVHEPFMEVQTGYGYQGVVMYDDQEDKMQCHICGEFYALLGKHSAMAHGVDSAAYRTQFGLSSKMALCSKRFSRLHREHIERHPEMKVVGAKNFKKHRPAYSAAKWSKIAKTGKAVMSRQNTLGLCELQMRARWDVVEKIVGREPSYKDLLKYDRVLLHRILNTGTLNGYRQKIGAKQHRPGSLPTDKLVIIAAMRKWASDKQKKMSSYRWVKSRQRPAIECIYKQFGSWQQAMTAAGLISGGSHYC